jgi:predicted Zn-dependent protease
MARMFQTLLQQRKSRPSAVSQFFATHPLAEDRITDVRAQIRTLPRRSNLVANDGRLGTIKQRVSRYNG